MKMSNTTKLLVMLLALITLVASGIAGWSLFFRDSKVILEPDYAPIEPEINAQPIPNDTGEKAESEAGGGSVSLTYSNQVFIDLSDQKAELVFANPNRSNQELVLQIIVQNEVIAQTGVLSPGYQISIVNLNEGATEKLVTGGYDGVFSVFFYDPVSGEKAVVGTEIPVFVIVNP